MFTMISDLLFDRTHLRHELEEVGTIRCYHGLSVTKAHFILVRKTFFFTLTEMVQQRFLKSTIK